MAPVVYAVQQGHGKHHQYIWRKNLAFCSSEDRLVWDFLVTSLFNNQCINVTGDENKSHILFIWGAVWDFFFVQHFKLQPIVVAQTVSVRASNAFHNPSFNFISSYFHLTPILSISHLRMLYYVRCSLIPVCEWKVPTPWKKSNQRLGFRWFHIYVGK